MDKSVVKTNQQSAEDTLEKLDSVSLSLEYRYLGLYQLL